MTDHARDSRKPGYQPPRAGTERDAASKIPAASDALEPLTGESLEAFEAKPVQPLQKMPKGGHGRDSNHGGVHEQAASEPLAPEAGTARPSENRSVVPGGKRAGGAAPVRYSAADLLPPTAPAPRPAEPPPSPKVLKDLFPPHVAPPTLMVVEEPETATPPLETLRAEYPYAVPSPFVPPQAPPANPLPPAVHPPVSNVPNKSLRHSEQPLRDERPGQTDFLPPKKVSQPITQVQPVEHRQPVRQGEPLGHDQPTEPVERSAPLSGLGTADALNSFSPPVAKGASVVSSQAAWAPGSEPHAEATVGSATQPGSVVQRPLPSSDRSAIRPAENEPTTVAPNEKRRGENVGSENVGRDAVTASSSDRSQPPGRGENVSSAEVKRETGRSRAAAVLITVPNVKQRPAGVTDEHLNEHLQALHTTFLAAEEEPTAVGYRVLDSAPPWLVSMVLHTVVLIILGVLVIEPLQYGSVSIVMDTTTEESGEPWMPDAGPIPTLEMSATDTQQSMQGESNDSKEFTTPKPPEIALEEMGQQGGDSALERAALKGRQGTAKRALLLAYGGTEDTEAAVRRGLEWLARQQRPDGQWSLKGPYANGGSFENSPAATAMALLAFLGAGHTHRSGDFTKEVLRGAKALVAMQDREGNFTRDLRIDAQRPYAQAQATIVLCELFSMSQDDAYREPAQRAIEYAHLIPASGSGGALGWRYRPQDDIDTSVTGWFVMALQSAKMAGLEVDEKTLQGVDRFLDQVTDDGALYRYQATSNVRISMTAEALLCRQYRGWERDDPRMLKGAQYILSEPLDWSQKDVYSWYYATQMLHHLGGSEWERWNDRMRDVIPKQQEATGRDRGSWNPEGDAHASAGGRLYTTCFCLYLLEVYYRHMPIYRQ